jgi:hypothetical protein
VLVELRTTASDMFFEDCGVDNDFVASPCPERPAARVGDKRIRHRKMATCNIHGESRRFITGSRMARWLDVSDAVNISAPGISGISAVPLMLLFVV